MKHKSTRAFKQVLGANGLLEYNGVHITNGLFVSLPQCMSFGQRRPQFFLTSAADAFFDLLERTETVNHNTQLTTY